MRVLIALAFVLALAGAAYAQCGSCPQPCQGVANPDFKDDDCSFTAILIIDESGSLGEPADTQQVINAVKAFYATLAQATQARGTAPSRVGVIRFNSQANVRMGGLMVDVTANNLDALNADIDTYVGRSRTDWGEALSLAVSTNWQHNGQSVTEIDVVLFFTDGNPTIFDGQCEESCAAANQFPATADAVPLPDNDLAVGCLAADAVKSRGIKLFLVGVGSGIAERPGAVQVVTGPTPYDPTVNGGRGNFEVADYVINPDINTLTEQLQSLIRANCGCEEETSSSIFVSGPSGCYPVGSTRTFSVSLRNNAETVNTLSTVSVTAPFNQGFTCNANQVGSNGNSRTFQVDRVIQPNVATQVLTCTWTPPASAIIGGHSVTVTGYDFAVCNEGAKDTGNGFTFFISDLDASITATLVTCGNTADATATVTAFRGREPYRYLWNTGATTNRITGLTVGTYTVTVTDNSGDSEGEDESENCQVTRTVTVVAEDPCPGADLEVIKTLDGEGVEGENPVECLFAGGNQETWRIVARNNGPGDAEGVTVTDTLPNGIIVNDARIVNGGACSISGRTITCSLGTLVNGASRTILVNVSAGPGEDERIICNRVVIGAIENEDPDPTNNFDFDCNRVCRRADLSITKTDGETVIVAGAAPNQYQYTLTVRNDGPSVAPNTRVEDILPRDGFIFSTVSASNGGQCSPIVGNGFNCNLGTLSVGASVTITVGYSTDADAKEGARYNVAGVWSDAFDTNTRNNLAVDRTDIITEADLSVVKSDGTNTVSAGDSPNTYIITVRNAGPSTARDVVVVDDWPADFTVSGSPITDAGFCVDIGSGSFSCSLGDIAVNAEVRIRVTYSVARTAEPCEVTNVVRVKSTGPCATRDPDMSNNKAFDRNVVEEDARLVITKFNGQSTLNKDNSLGPQTYTVRVSNSGNSVARAVSIIDTWPRVFQQFPKTLRTTQGSCTTHGADFYCELGDIDNQTVEITVQFLVSQKCIECDVSVENSVTGFTPSQSTPTQATDSTFISCGGSPPIPDDDDDDDDDDKKRTTRALNVESQTEKSAEGTVLKVKITNTNEESHKLEHVAWAVKHTETGNAHIVKLHAEHELIKSSSCKDLVNKELAAGESVACNVELKAPVAAFSKLIVKAADEQATSIVAAN